MSDAAGLRRSMGRIHLAADGTRPDPEEQVNGLNITLENIDHITADSRAVYVIKEDPGAVPPQESLSRGPEQ